MAENPPPLLVDAQVLAYAVKTVCALCIEKFHEELQKGLADSGEAT